VQPRDVYEVLKKIGATHLHHANSVTTSSTFLEQGALLSRGFVEDNKLKQTPQGSDQIDKKYNIWHRVFIDHVDIHDRGGRRKGPNQYGPALFVLDLDVLLGLPAGTDIQLTKRNPIYWYDNQPDAERYFQTLDELTKSIHFGDFDKMLVIQTPTGKIDLPNRQAQLILDDPQRKLSSGEDAYSHAETRLKASAAAGRIKASIEKRDCQADCICLKKYAAYPIQKFDFYFV
jgi:hypothetical protein